MKKIVSLTIAVLLIIGLCLTAVASNKIDIISVSESNAGGSDYITSYQSTARWSSVPSSYLYKTSSGYTAVDSNNNSVFIANYDSNFKKLSSKTVKMELPLFGGFYCAPDYNYILFGANNHSESDTAEVFRLVRYDKSFNRIDSGSVTDCFTYEPFEAGSSSISENNGLIMVHTSRKRYLTNDNLHHQSQLTIIFDKNTLSVQNSLSQFQPNHVSHSFNQFVIADGNSFILVDHGDAYPRSITLTEYDIGSERYKNEISLFDIPGATGANCTGVTVGGLASSSSSYLVAINTIDHSKVTSYTSFTMNGLSLDERNAVLLIKSKNSNSVKQVALSNYINKGYLASTPYIVKINDDIFAVIWQEFKYINSIAQFNDLKFAVVDGNGNIIRTGNAPSGVLSADCQPIYDNGNLIWYVNNGNSERKFNRLSLSESAPQNETHLSFEKSTYYLKVGESTRLFVNSDSGFPSFSSSNESVAYVDESGNVYAGSTGRATITASIPGTNLSATCLVVVTESGEQPETSDENDNNSGGMLSTLFGIFRWFFRMVISIMPFIIRLFRRILGIFI